ncbi:hypothetical protein FSP39_008914 [Pinctada imbricata]|uniref:CUB domain-containing protein n=1 Tax=Pinctada imbricata TaxID=66713 RepID=A0AA89C6X4_PINIB|nr:hypothetical protein FSP39_008914 [Pinctada imbricata]
METIQTNHTNNGNHTNQPHQQRKPYKPTTPTMGTIQTNHTNNENHTKQPHHQREPYIPTTPAMETIQTNHTNNGNHTYQPHQQREPYKATTPTTETIKSTTQTTETIQTNHTNNGNHKNQPHQQRKPYKPITPTTGTIQINHGNYTNQPHQQREPYKTTKSTTEIIHINHTNNGNHTNQPHQQREPYKPTTPTTETIQINHTNNGNHKNQPHQQRKPYKPTTPTTEPIKTNHTNNGNHINQPHQQRKPYKPTTETIQTNHNHRNHTNQPHQQIVGDKEITPKTAIRRMNRMNNPVIDGKILFSREESSAEETELFQAQTKYACVTSSGLGNSGEYDSSQSSSDEVFDSVSSPLGNFLGDVLVGHLTCIDRPQSLILVTKYIYGFGGFSKCAAPDAACDEEDFSDPLITPQCDGRPLCLVKVPARNLPKCGTLSNFVHVEYECVYSWSLYNICKDISSTVKGTEIYIASPNFFNNAVPPSRTCECIVQGRHDDQIMMQYAHTDILDDGNGQCKGNYFLVESKMANQSSVAKTTQVCGKRTTNNQLYRGTVRVTYTISSTARKTDGFLAKFMVPPAGPGGTNEIAVECGAVRSGPNSGPPQNQNPPQGPPQNNQGPQQGHGGPNQGPQSNYYPPHGMYPPHGPGMYPPQGPYPGPYQKSPRIPPPPQFGGQGGPNNPMNPMNRMGNNMNNQMSNTSSSNGTNPMSNGPGNWNGGGNGPNQNFNGGLDPRMNRPGNQNRQFGPQNPYMPKGMLRNVGPIRNLDKFSQGPPSLPIPGPPFNPFAMNGPPPKSWVPNLQGLNNWQNNQGQWQGNRGQNNGNWGGGGPGQGQGPNTNSQQGSPNNGPQSSNPGNSNSPKGVEFIGKIARKNQGGNGGAPPGGGGGQGGGGGGQTPKSPVTGKCGSPTATSRSRWCGASGWKQTGCHGVRE